jgi:hypothetical protein
MNGSSSDNLQWQRVFGFMLWAMFALMFLAAWVMYEITLLVVWLLGWAE